MNPDASSTRLAHVDALRGIAALLVAWTHYSDALSAVAKPREIVSTVLCQLPAWLNLGRVGVVLFFGLSGFVIYGSLEKGGPRCERRFAVSRFFRLYPAFWLSLLLSSLLLWPLAGKAVDWPMLWANVTMYPSLFGQPRVRTLYWTLEVELAFYFLCWGLYRGGLMRRPLLLPAVIVACLLCWWLWPHSRGATESAAGGRGFGLPRYLAIMFWGALVRQCYDETGGFRVGVPAHAKTWLLAALTILLVGAFSSNAVVWLARGFSDGTSAGPTPPPTSVAYLLALPLFWGWIARARMANASLLPWIGTVSYSVYLFHTYARKILFGVVPAGALSALPFWLLLPVVLAVAVAVSALAYYAVERPAMRLGAWINRRDQKLPAPTDFVVKGTDARNAP